MCNWYKRIDHCLREPACPVAAIDVFGYRCKGSGTSSKHVAGRPISVQVCRALKRRNAKLGSIGAVWPNVQPGVRELKPASRREQVGTFIVLDRRRNVD